MKVLLISDIHGNSDALDIVLAEPEARECREIWCLGDLAGYGPEPEVCFDMLKERRAHFIPGNHDLYYSGRLNKDYFSAEAARALVLTSSKIKPEFKDLMKSIPVKIKRRGFCLVHGSLIKPETDYILTSDDAVQNFRILKGKGLIYGHTHRQGCFIYEHGVVLWLSPRPEETISYRGRKILINPGSIGQPRDGDPRAAWAVLDTSDKSVKFYRTEYDIAAYQDKMREIGSSDFLLTRVEKGI